ARVHSSAIEYGTSARVLRPMLSPLSPESPSSPLEMKILCSPPVPAPPEPAPPEYPPERPPEPP
ncbi:hypothetical protein M9458_035484, partial [Cirrhinus mrigala]